MIVWVTLNQPIFDVTNRNRDRMGPVLGEGLKESSILNPSDFELIPLDIRGLLRPVVLSINQYWGDIWFPGKIYGNFEFRSSLNIWGWFPKIKLQKRLCFLQVSNHIHFSPAFLKSFC
jgi:hypothetical protein